MDKFIPEKSMRTTVYQFLAIVLAIVGYATNDGDLILVAIVFAIAA